MWILKGALDGAGYDAYSNQDDRMGSTCVVKGGDREEWAIIHNRRMYVLEVAEELPHLGDVGCQTERQTGRQTFRERGSARLNGDSTQQRSLSTL